jgi:hypothetical protein
LLLASYPLAWISRRVSVQPRLRALLDGVRVNGTIESIDTTNRRMPVGRIGWDGDPGDGRHLMKQIVYRYSVDGRVIRKATPPFAPSLAEGRSVGDVIAVYVFRPEPEHGEADIYRINDP